MKDGTEYLALFLNVIAVRTALKVEKGSPMWVSCRNIIRDIMAPVGFHAESHYQLHFLLDVDIEPL